jgi:hypothetical protein
MTNLFKPIFGFFFFCLYGYGIDDTGVSESIAESKKRKVFLAKFEPEAKEFFLDDQISFQIDEVWIEHSWTSGIIYPNIRTDLIRICIKIIGVHYGEDWTLIFNGRGPAGHSDQLIYKGETSMLAKLKEGFSANLYWRDKKAGITSQDISKDIRGYGPFIREISFKYIP